MTLTSEQKKEIIKGLYTRILANLVEYKTTGKMEYIDNVNKLRKQVADFETPIFDRLNTRPIPLILDGLIQAISAKINE